MRRALLILLLGCAARSTTPCDSELVATWNRFAEDANGYVKGIAGGVVNAKQRARVMREWTAVTRCECW